MPANLLRLLPLILLLAPAPAPAQEDDAAMEVQRCIWACMAEHGVDSPEYPACTEQYCSDGGALEETAAEGSPALPPPGDQSPLPPGPGVLEGQWVWGDHPQLGPSAHIQTAAGTIGFGCVGEGPMAGLRISNTLFAGNAVTILTDPGAWVSSYPRREGDWSGKDDNICFLHAAEYSMDHALFVVPAAIAALNAEGNRTRITLSDGQRDVDVYSGPEALAQFGGYVLPLTGAHHALSVLLAHCPLAESEMAMGCGGD